MRPTGTLPTLILFTAQLRKDASHKDIQKVLIFLHMYTSNCVDCDLTSLSFLGKWFEVTPHEAGFTELGVFIETSLLGSEFQSGEVKEKKQEMDMVKLQGKLSHPQPYI